MVGVTRRVMGDEDAFCGLHLLPVFQDLDPIFRHGTRLTPELVHPLAVDAGGALYEPRRVGKVRVADLVNVEGRVGQHLREMSRGTGVVKVYMREVDLPHVFVGDATILQASGEPVEAVRRTSLDEGGGSPVLAEQDERSYNLPGIHEVKVYDLYLHLWTFGLWLQAEIIQTLFVRLPARVEKERTLFWISTSCGSYPSRRTPRSSCSSWTAWEGCLWTHQARRSSRPRTPRTSTSSPPAPTSGSRARSRQGLAQGAVQATSASSDTTLSVSRSGAGYLAPSASVSTSARAIWLPA